MKEFLQRYITHGTKKISSELIIYSVFDTKDKVNKLIAVTDLKNNALIDKAVSSFRDNKITNRTDHKNLVKFHDIGIIHEGFLSYVYVVFDIEIINFKSLEKSFITKPLPLENVILIICKVLNGLHYAHSTGLIHRNITTNSILYLNYDVKLWDFHRLFIPRSDSDDEQLKHLSYKSLEFFQSRKLCSYLSDVYSIGVVLFRCVNQFESWLEVIKQVKNLKEQIKTGNLINHIAYQGNVPNEVKTIINKACSTTKDNFYTCVLELQQDLKNVFSIKG